MFEPKTLERVQAALSVGQQVAMAVQGGKPGLLDKATETKLVVDVARLTLEEDDRQRNRLIVTRGH